jgi:hypothetical protein
MDQNHLIPPRPAFPAATLFLVSAPGMRRALDRPLPRGKTEVRARGGLAALGPIDPPLPLTHFSRLPGGALRLCLSLLRVHSVLTDAREHSRPAAAKVGAPPSLHALLPLKKVPSRPPPQAGGGWGGDWPACARACVPAREVEQARDAAPGHPAVCAVDGVEDALRSTGRRGHRESCRPGWHRNPEGQIWGWVGSGVEAWGRGCLEADGVLRARVHMPCAACRTTST